MKKKSKTNQVDTRVKLQFQVKVRSKLCRAACWTKASNIPDTFKAPIRHLPANFKTPIRHLSDTLTFLEVETLSFK